MSSEPTKDTRTDRTATPLTYTVSCADCSFETIVEGDTSDLFDVIDDHEEKYRHFVEAQAKRVE